MNKQTNEIDLHGVKHDEVQFILADHLFWQSKSSCTIITGNSEKMKKIVIDWLEKHKYSYFISWNNLGKIVVSV